MYKNILRDEDIAFSVEEILGQDHNGADLIVIWYKETQGGRYVSMGIDSGEFHISKNEVMHYIEV